MEPHSNIKSPRYPPALRWADHNGVQRPAGPAFRLFQAFSARLKIKINSIFQCDAVKPHKNNPQKSVVGDMAIDFLGLRLIFSPKNQYTEAIE
jgi:hypothetical protein